MEDRFKVDKSRFVEEAQKRNIWIPSADPKYDDTMIIEGKIEFAKYDHAKETLAVVVRLSSGECRGTYTHKSVFKFHGKDWDKLPKEDTDMEMEKTAALFNKRKGAKVKLEVFAHQMRTP
jgi:hypothetical protein